jgi:hypothetical protein
MGKISELTKRIVLPRRHPSVVQVMPPREMEESWDRKSLVKRVALFMVCGAALLGFENYVGPQSMLRLPKLRSFVPLGSKPAPAKARNAKRRPAVQYASYVTSTRYTQSGQNTQYVQRLPYVKDGTDSQVHTFFTALRASDTRRMRTLLNTGWVSVNSARYKGFTPLEIAVWQGNAKVVKFLLDEQKADPNVQDAYGTTALYYANQYHRAAIAQMLIKAGAY